MRYLSCTFVYGDRNTAYSSARSLCKTHHGLPLPAPGALIFIYLLHQPEGGREAGAEVTVLEMKIMGSEMVHDFKTHITSYDKRDGIEQLKDTLRSPF